MYKQVNLKEMAFFKSMLYSSCKFYLLNVGFSVNDLPRNMGFVFHPTVGLMCSNNCLARGT